MDPQLNVQIPAAGREVWECFIALTAKRRQGFGQHPLTFTDIEAWSRLYGVRLTPWELDTLLQLDSKTLTVAAAHQAAKDAN